ncbi:cadherin repeat domain-containing protein [Colwellia demingiae]|uniref:Cadherin repeat domain-containing protein n=1 Tax=Colwellia demingiae TaxID=89401 RepID=A0A5C6QI85_9GAMM|nr:cadherin domain-containing protein [Colwellia demingiae]TWX68664.1 cadherin repeat domain-containing protein [Colwellia demingiae]
MIKLTLLVELANGERQTFSLVELQILTALNGAIYTVVKEGTQQAPQELVLKRKDDDLEVEVEGVTVAKVEGFYSESMTANFSADGSFTPAEGMSVSSTDKPVIIEGNEPIVRKSQEDNDFLGLSPLTWGVGLFGASVLVSVALDGDDEDYPSYQVTLNPVAGPFKSIATVTLYDKDGNELANKKHDFSDGPVVFTIDNGYQGPLLAKVVDSNGSEGDYLDETTGKLVSLGDSSLRAMGHTDGFGDVIMSITPLTELASRQAGISEDNKVTTENVAVNADVSKLFDVEDILAPVTTILDADYDSSDGLNAAEQYGNILALLSGTENALASLNGGDSTSTLSIDVTINKIRTEIETQANGELAFTKSGFELLQDGVEAFEAGVNAEKADLAAALIKPPIIDAAQGSVNKVESEAGVAVQVANVKIGDSVVIQWGNQFHIVEISGAELLDGVATILVPGSVINAGGEGRIEVTSHISEQVRSPATIINVDTINAVFDSGSLATDLNENSGTHQVVYQAVTNDENARYSLTGDDAALFAINSITGTVILTANPDDESKADYRFTVVASDLAGNSSEQVVTLDITDLDEVAPMITSAATASSIHENSGASQVVYTITSTDSDDVSVGTTAYRLKAGDDAALFTINSGTGVVTLTANPDDETKADYNFTVVASDAAGNSSEQAVLLDITDLDDVAPRITSVVTPIALDENSGAGQVVYMVTSTDSDDVSTGATVYSLKAGDDAALFTINSITGAVILTANPDDETKADYNFTVVATDTAGNSSEQAITLDIIDLDEVAPTITSATIATALDENSGAGQVVYTVTSTDSDDIATGATAYSLKAGDDAALFTINSSTGAVILTADPDNESKADYSFTVIATDTAGNSSEQAITLDITDLDDVAPTITSAATATALDENSGAGQVVYTVTSTDSGDIATGATAYGLKTGDDAALFTINSSTGVVTLTANPDDETKADYNFTVVATDTAGNSSEQAITFDITDLDEVAPTITSASSATALDENSGAGQVVYTVTSTDSGDIASGATAYSLKTGEDATLFTINSSSGAVTLTANPDDETKANYSFTVVASDAAGNSSEQAITLDINDLDEVAPTITSAATATALDENSGAGQVVYTVTSTDSGDIATGATTYSLKTGDDAALFTINSSTGAVTLTANPDDEAKADYNFRVVASDAAGNSSEQAITLDITDLDDVAPTITSAVTASALDENSGAGQVVYTVTSTDSGDITTGATAYSLKTGDDAALFTINSNTGEVTLTANPDDETKANYNFTVVASDAAGNSSEQAITLDITDLDEVAPTITSASSATGIDENSGASQVVYTVTSTDSGDIATGATAYSLKAGDDAALFTINSSTGAVTLTANPDDETKADYSFTVVASDAAGNSSEQGITLDITDLDEVAPTITSASSATAIDENSGAGQVVYTVTSTDSGDIATGATAYSLKTGDDAALFTINSSTGAVTLTANPDDETKADYNFTVVATDTAGNSSEQAITLDITDLDEVGPTITSASSATALDENSGAGQEVYTVTSTDSGDIATGAPTYSLKAGDDAVLFTINSSTGVVILTANPDDEIRQDYNFTVVATDGAGNSSEKAITLDITDLDEVAPTITSASSATALDENSGAGQVVYTITSTDNGDIASGATVYSLKNGDDAALFTINSSSGAVTLTANPDDETKADYNFTVVASDSAGNSTEQAITLDITDLDDVAPTITSAATATAIDENSGAGQVVYTVTSTDSGDIASGATVYSLKSGDDAALFTINSTTGAVTLTANPDDETKADYSFIVVASDSAGNSSEQAITLDITDLDEVGPTITSASSAIALDENSGAGQVVYTVTSTDSGDITTGTTAYSLKTGDDAALFTINSGTGVVTLTANPNDETKADYNFTVVATDGVGNSSEQAITLDITDLDEVAPTITSASSATALDENSGAGQVVYTITSTDNGDITTGATVYSLKTGEDAALFTINSSTGAVTLTANPDDETKADYSFTVVASDGAGNNSEKAVTLDITDLDEIAPTITSAATATAIDENSGAGQVVYTVTSTDSGDITMGTTAYRLKTGEDAALFTINSSSGEVTLTANPDDETKADYSFTVVASDGAGNNSEQAVTLDITDLDEIAPTITSAATAAAIDENSGAGQVVYTVTSTDSGDIASGATVYSLKSGDDAALFTINSSTGAVTLTANPDDETKADYSFTVVASDGAGNNSEQAVTLDITDLDEIAPTITSAAIAAAIDENSGAGQVVYTVTSTDSGDIASGATVYSLKSGDDAALFTINSSTGAVTLTANPDDEIKADYSFIVVATDAGNNSSEQVVTLDINDLDEVAPIINSVVLSDTDLAKSETATLTITFSEAVTNFTNDDIDLTGANGTLSAISTSDSGVTWTGTFTPTDGITDTSNTITVVNTGIADLAGNVPTDAVTSDNFAIDTTVVVNEAVVVFDLVGGTSSDHSSRTFDSNTTYTIYIKVDSSVSTLLTNENSANGTWGLWSGADNLGSDDRVIIAGNGLDLKGGAGNLPVASVSETVNALNLWTTGSTTVVVINQAGMLFRNVDGENDTFDIWTGTVLNMQLDAGAGSDLYTNTMPVGIMTSQGLA